MRNKIHRFWNDLSLFWKTCALSMGLAVFVVVIGEGTEGLAKNLLSYADISLKRNIREALLWMIAIIASSLLGSLIISRIITGSLTRIQPVVERLARGALDSRIERADAARGDEIGSLSRSFNQMADNVSRLLEGERTLLRDISHEMRSPLARMKMAIALIKQEAGHPEFVEANLRQLEKDIGRLELMIGQTLERARLETIKESGFEKDDFDLAALVLESIEEQVPATSGGGIDFQGLDSAPYYGNAVLVRRAVDNLIKNAIHYTAPGSVVSVKLRAVSGTLILDVVDQGPGVPDGQLENIFKPFYRVDSARTQNSGGFGLGLAIARQAAQLHGGQVTAVNVAAGQGRGRGLKVTLALPVNNGTVQPGGQF